MSVLLAEMSSMYQRQGFSNEVAGLIVRDQGMNTLDELSIFKDEECKSLFKLAHRPYGTISDTNAVAIGISARILNPALIIL